VVDVLCAIRKWTIAGEKSPYHSKPQALYSQNNLARCGLDGGNAVWLDIIGLALAVSLLEAAILGRGRTHGKGRVRYWRVAPWLRPILAVVGMVVLGLVVVHFLRTF